MIRRRLGSAAVTLLGRHAPPADHISRRLNLSRADLRHADRRAQSTAHDSLRHQSDYQRCYGADKRECKRPADMRDLPLRLRHVLAERLRLLG